MPMGASSKLWSNESTCTHHLVLRLKVAKSKRISKPSGKDRSRDRRLMRRVAVPVKK